MLAIRRQLLALIEATLERFIAPPGGADDDRHHRPAPRRAGGPAGAAPVAGAGCHRLGSICQP